MSRLFSTSLFCATALFSIADPQQTVLAQGKVKPPDIEFLKPGGGNENNVIQFEFKVKPKGTTLDKVTLDILPMGGKVSIDNPTPLPSGKGYHQRWEPPVLDDDGNFVGEGKTKKLPPGKYYVVVIVTFNEKKTIWDHQVATLTGKKVEAIGSITDEVDFLPKNFVSPNRIKMHGKYVAPGDNFKVKEFGITLLDPNRTVQRKEVTTSPTYSHTFDLSVTGGFAGYVRAAVTNSEKGGNVVGHVYSTRHTKDVP